MHQIAINPTQSPAATGAKWSVLVILEYLSRFAMALESCRKRHETRMQFSHIEARILRDAGISEAQRFIEVNKPF